MSFAKFLGTLFLQNIIGRLLQLKSPKKKYAKFSPSLQKIHVNDIKDLTDTHFSIIDFECISHLFLDF